MNTGELTEKELNKALMGTCPRCPVGLVIETKIADEADTWSHLSLKTLETIDILADPKTMRQLKGSAKDIKDGRLIDFVAMHETQQS